MDYIPPSYKESCKVFLITLRPCIWLGKLPDQLPGLPSSETPGTPPKTWSAYGKLTRVTIIHLNKDNITCGIKYLVLNLMVVRLWVRAAAGVIQNILCIAGENSAVDRHKPLVVVTGVIDRAEPAFDTVPIGSVDRQGADVGAAPIFSLE